MPQSFNSELVIIANMNDCHILARGPHRLWKAKDWGSRKSWRILLVRHPNGCAPCVYLPSAWNGTTSAQSLLRSLAPLNSETAFLSIGPLAWHRQRKHHQATFSYVYLMVYRLGQASK